MDKQILGLSYASALVSQPQPSTDGASEELPDLMDPQEDKYHSDGGGSTHSERVIKKEEFLPSHDFQPIRATGSSSANATTGFSGSGLDSSSSPSLNSEIESSSLRSAGNLEPDELTKVGHEKNWSAYDAAIVSEIDQIVKKHADHILHALEGLSSRLSQLESITHLLKNTVVELEVTVDKNNGSADGKLSLIENIPSEVQDGVKILNDEQEIMETKPHHSKVQASEAQKNQPEVSIPGVSKIQPEASRAQQVVQQPSQPPITPPQASMIPDLPTPDAPPPPPQQNPPQSTPQLPQPQKPSSLKQESYFSPAQAMEKMNPHYQAPVGQPHQPPPPSHYQSAHQLPRYHQPLQPQPQPLIPQHPEGSAPYLPNPAYSSSMRQPAPFSQPPSAPPQQFGPNVYGHPASKPTAMHPSFSSGYYISAMGPSFYESTYGPPYQQSSFVMNPPNYPPGAAASGGSGYYSRLPTAQVLPQALPTTALASDTGSGSKEFIDELVEKVSVMGYSRGRIRAAARELRENGLSVDLTVLIDKLINDDLQPKSGGRFGPFGR